MVCANIKPSHLTWARERAGRETADLVRRFPKLEAWEAGESQPTLRQAVAFARAVHLPVGDLFLPGPLKEEPLPIPDFRTMAGKPARRASTEMLDTIYDAQYRQGWYHEFMRVADEPKVEFVGSLTTDTPVPAAAAAMAEVFGFDLGARTDCPTWADALRLLIAGAERAGVLVMVSGVVESNTHRRLDPDEFRGLVLADARAPLVFINGAETKAAQMFTLAHELAHLWLGASALSDSSARPINSHRQKINDHRGQEIELWCNVVAAELLVPLTEIEAELRPGETLGKTLKRLARRFKVSTLVILRRLLDVGALKRSEFDAAWQTEFNRHVPAVRGEAGGGDFYLTTLSRVGRRFAEAVVASTLEGRTLYTDAFSMLGVTNAQALNKIGQRVGIVQ